MKEELNIIDLVDMLMRRWWIIFTSMMIVGIMAFVFTEVFIQPSYRSEGSLYVNASSEQQMQRTMTQYNLNASQQLVNTYSEILMRRTFLESVAKDIDNKYSVAQLRQMLMIEPVNETEIMQITVTSNDPDDSYLIAHSVLMRAPDELIRVVEAGSVKLLDDAKKNTVAVSPNIRQNTLIGALIGILLGVFVIFLLEIIDTRIKDSESITSKYKEPLLGEIPSLTDYRK